MGPTAAEHSTTTEQPRPDERTLVVEGAISGADVAGLRSSIIAALGDGHDIVLDVRGVTSFDDAATPALTAARSRAKHLKHRIVVLDGEDGPTTRSLRRSGHIFRFPVFTDGSAALAALRTAPVSAYAR